MTSTAPDLRARIPAPADYGDLVSPAERSLAQVHQMVGGAGTAEWAQLFSPFHLAGGWDGPIEFVKLRPGSSCGEHLHDVREEIYFILTGAAWIRINGQEHAVSAGDLITCPIGTQHAIGVRDDAAGPMTFLVVEMHPGRAGGLVYAPARIAMGGRARDALGWWGYDEDYLQVATVDLSQRLTGPWGTFAEIEVPPETTVGPHEPRRATAELLLTTAGRAEITLGQEAHRGGPGLVVAAVSPVTVRNPSDDQPLRLITLGVRH